MHIKYAKVKTTEFDINCIVYQNKNKLSTQNQLPTKQNTLGLYSTFGRV